MTTEQNQSSHARHSKTVEFLRERLIKAENRSDFIVAWLIVGFSLAGIFFASLIVYLLVVEQ